MSFKLINLDIGMDVDITLPSSLSESLSTQWERRTHIGLQREFSQAFSIHFEKMIPEFVDWDIKPPTKSQLAYAALLCSKFGLSMEPDEQSFRGPMAQFLGYHSYVTGGFNHEVQPACVTHETPHAGF